MFYFLLSARVALALLCVGPFLGGCGSTTLQARKAELAVLMDANAMTDKVLARIQEQSLPPDYDVHIFVSFAALNAALMAVDGYKTMVPGIADASLEIAQIRAVNIGAIPSAVVAAKVRKGDFEAAVDIGVVLTPINLASGATALQLRVVHFVPRVRWWLFELTKIQIIQSLLSIELDKLTRELPAIELPFETAIQLGSPAMQIRSPIDTGNESTLEVEVLAPSTIRSRSIKVLDYTFVGGGMHVFGSLK